jgi:hypothetical protein
MHFSTLTLTSRLGESALGVVCKSKDAEGPGLVRILCGKVDLKEEVSAEKLLETVSPLNFRQQAGFALATKVVEDDGVFALHRPFVNASAGARLKEKGAIDRLKTLIIMEQTCRLLKSWTEAKFHPVLRPSQLGLDADGRVVLLDPGLHESLVSHALVEESSIPKLIPAPYAGKNFLAKQRFDLSGTIYSIAVTAHELLTGKLPCTIEIPKVQLTARSALTPDSGLPSDLRDFLQPLLREEATPSLQLLADQFKALQTPGTPLPGADAGAPPPPAAAAIALEPSSASSELVAKTEAKSPEPQIKLQISENEPRRHMRRGSSTGGISASTVGIVVLGVGTLCLLPLLFQKKDAPPHLAQTQPAQRKATPPPAPPPKAPQQTPPKSRALMDSLIPVDIKDGGGPQVVKQELVQEEVSLFDRMMRGEDTVADAPAVLLSAADIPKAYGKLRPPDFQINLLRAECNNILASIPAERREMEGKRFDYLQDVMSRVVKAIRYGTAHKGQFPCGEGKAMVGELTNADWSGITVITSSGEKKISWQQGGLALLHDLTVWYAQEPLAKGLPDDDVPVEILAEAARWYANLAVIAAWYGDDEMAAEAYRKVRLISPSLGKEIKPMLTRPPELAQ